MASGREANLKFLLIALMALVIAGCTTRADERLAHYQPTYGYCKMPDGSTQRVFTGPCWMDPDTDGP
jgi:hypothetical protein